MGIIKYGLWGFFCLLSFTVYSQTSIRKEKKVIWTDPVTINQDDEKVTLLQFSDMGDLNHETNLSLLNFSVKLPTLGIPSDIIISIDDTEYIWPTPKEHSEFKDKITNEELTHSYSISQSGENYFIDITLTPYCRPINAQTFKKLTAYTLNISYNNESHSLKSESSLKSYAENSVLNTGSWVKVGINNSGIHKISYAKLKEWGISNPQNVGVYGNGGKMIPSSNNVFRHDDLVENAIWHQNNAIYFYAEGPVTWSYNNSIKLFVHEKHDFSNSSYYFITEKNTASLKINESNLQAESSNKEINTFNDYDYHEEDSRNLIKSGNKWFGEQFGYYSNKTHDFNFAFPNIKPSSTAKALVKLAARSGTRTAFELLVDEFPIAKTYISSVTTSSHTSYYAYEGTINTSFPVNTDNINLSLNFDITNSQSSAIGYLDYINLNVERQLTFTNNELLFRNIESINPEGNTQYNINSSKDLIIWDITNPLLPLSIVPNREGSTVSFDYNASELKEFVAFTPSGNFPTPDFVGNVDNQNIHSCPFVDYIIVCHPDFITQANDLGKIHNEYNGMTYTVVTTEQIYNEFSSGKPDVTAIRSFVRMLYDKAGTKEENRPKNLLLFGDGSYDNRQGINDNTNKIPTYQSDNSIHNTDSFVSDDYFGLLDENEGANIKSEKVDIGIGRFPVNTSKEATNAVNKTYKYYYEQSNDQWKSALTFVGDDGDGNIHMRDANSLTTKIEKNHPEYNISKFYFDAYEKITTTSGHSIPEIEEDIFNAISNGTLVFNYTGHGGPTVLAHERIITKSHIANWNNIDKLPVFVTATCEFSRFDDKGLTSAGEDVFLNPLGGAIALYTTTRIVYSSLNKQLNTSFYNFAFERDESGKPYTLGEIMMHTKNGLSASVNKLNFSLLGDPAIRLIYPKSKISTLKINEGNNTINALSKVKVSGQITNGLNIPNNSFNGEIMLSVFDKQSQVETKGNEGATPFEYATFDNIIFKGPTSVENGKFEAEFIVPKDIRYNFDNGKISYYAFSNENDDEAFGAFSDIIIGGIDETANNDEAGPEINLWLNNKNFKNGGTVGLRPILMADISDQSGINTTGSGIGHDITCIIDDMTSNPIILNNDFEATINSYTNGTLTRVLTNLEEGNHTLTVKAWDAHNNSSSNTINFKVSEDGDISISGATIYPNPVQKGQSSFISFKHDDPYARLNLNIQIFNMSGQRVAEQSTSVISLLNTTPPIEIKAESNIGTPLNAGIYIYNIDITSQTGRKGKVSGKFMVTQ